MDDKKQPISDTPSDVPPVGDTGLPPALPLPEDAPPLPPLSPEEVKTPTLPIPKDEEKVVPAENPSSKPDTDIPIATPENNDVTPKESDAVSQPETDAVTPGAQPDTNAVTPVLQPDTTAQPESETTSVAPPEKEEMPVEAEFPGQPLPVEAQQNLEDKAKEMIDKDGGVKNRKVEVVGKPKGNVKKTLVGMLLFVLLGGGAFAGMKLMGNTTENRSQAGADVDDYCYCGSKTTVCGKKNIKITCGPPGSGKDLQTGLPGCKWVTYECGSSEVPTVRCCDGTSYKTNTATAVVCQGHGGWDDPNKNNDCGEIPVSQCTCDSWNNACGVNCRFPSGTGAAAQQKANSTCKTIIAMCDPGNGKVSYQVFTSDHKCRGQVSVCNNPVAEPDCKEDPKVCNEGCAEGECGDGMVCDTTSNTCRNPICADSVNCVCPDGDLICNDLSCSSSDLELGQAYTFTCSAQVTGNKKVEDIQLYEFQYQRDTEGWVDLPLSALDSNISSELFIEDSGNYVVQCRACEDKKDKTKCTPYQITAAD